MMVVVRRGQAEQRLEEAMHAGRVEEVAPAHDVGDALRPIVDDDCEVIARRRVLAREDDVAQAAGSAVMVPVSVQARGGMRASAASMSSRSA